MYPKIDEVPTYINLGPDRALCHEVLSNSETKEPGIFEVMQLKFTIRAT